MAVNQWQHHRLPDRKPKSFWLELKEKDKSRLLNSKLLFFFAADLVVLCARLPEQRRRSVAISVSSSLCDSSPQAGWLRSQLRSGLKRSRWRECLSLHGNTSQMASLTVPFYKGHGSGNTSKYRPVSLSILMNTLTLRNESWSVSLCIIFKAAFICKRGRGKRNEGELFIADNKSTQQNNSSSKLFAVSHLASGVLTLCGWELMKYDKPSAHLQVFRCG